MPTITTAQIKSTLQSAKQSAANKLHSAGQKHERCIKKSSRANPQCGKQTHFTYP